jgi:hypothetical protein
LAKYISLIDNDLRFYRPILVRGYVILPAASRIAARRFFCRKMAVLGGIDVAACVNRKPHRRLKMLIEAAVEPSYLDHVRSDFCLVSESGFILSTAQSTAA